MRPTQSLLMSMHDCLYIIYFKNMYVTDQPYSISLGMYISPQSHDRQNRAHDAMTAQDDLAPLGFTGVTTGREMDGNGESCAVMWSVTRFGFEPALTGAFWLQPDPETCGKHPGAACFRVATWVRLEDGYCPGRGVFVVSTHLDHWSHGAREHGARLVRARVSQLLAHARAGDAAIVCGDFNASPGGRVHEIITELNTPLADAVASLPSSKAAEGTLHMFDCCTARPASRIDWVLHSAHLAPVAVTVDHTVIHGVPASDHWFVAADLSWRANESASKLAGMYPPLPVLEPGEYAVIMGPDSQYGQSGWVLSSHRCGGSSVGADVTRVMIHKRPCSTHRWHFEPAGTAWRIIVSANGDE